ncbi:MAG: MotA/TolQ/ExbB proton channel family protein [Candidatus Coatesbacteria bacterium]|nr:MotA/TolQ/ExbB proton channel family protein [Candidatus Coatesbacteria bacterium]
MRMWKLVTWMLVLCLFMVFTSNLLAEDPKKEATTEKKEQKQEEKTAAKTKTLRDLWQQGGFFMWGLLICSIVGLIFSIERFIVLFVMLDIDQTAFRKEIKDTLLDKSIELDAAVDKAGKVCDKYPGPVAAVFKSGLYKATLLGLDAATKAMETRAGIELSFLERGLVALSSVVNIAPLIGFLGTVSGMINAFDAIALAGQVKPQIVASGISEALITTAAGLMIAIPVQAVQNLCLSRIDKFVVAIEEAASDMEEILLVRGAEEEE